MCGYSFVYMYSTYIYIHGYTHNRDSLSSHINMSNSPVFIHTQKCICICFMQCVYFMYFPDAEHLDYSDIVSDHFKTQNLCPLYSPYCKYQT